MHSQTHRVAYLTTRIHREEDLLTRTHACTHGNTCSYAQQTGPSPITGTHAHTHTTHTQRNTCPHVHRYTQRNTGHSPLKHIKGHLPIHTHCGKLAPTQVRKHTGTFAPTHTQVNTSSHSHTNTQRITPPPTHRPTLGHHMHTNIHTQNTCPHTHKTGRKKTNMFKNWLPFQ